MTGVTAQTSRFDDDRSPATRKTSSEPLVEALSEEIISGAILAGTHLDEASLCKRFSLSRTPVREALHQLCARNLAEHIPFRGVIVREMSSTDIDTLFEAMSEIEALCGRLAAVRMGIGDRAKLIEMHEIMVQQAQDGDHAGYTAMNLAFHDLIYLGSGNREIFALAQAMRAKIAPYRYYQLRDAGRLQRSCEEHAEICEAILAQNGAAAELALKRHLVSAAQEVIIQRQRRDRDKESRIAN